MPHLVTAGFHPDFYILTLSGNLEIADVFIADKLHLNEGRRIYILVDSSAVNSHARPPQGFGDALTTSFIAHPNIAHIAAYTPSPLLRIAGYIVLKAANWQKITVHHSYAEAHKTLVDYIRAYQPHDEDLHRGDERSM